MNKEEIKKSKELIRKNRNKMLKLKKNQLDCIRQFATDVFNKYYLTEKQALEVLEIMLEGHQLLIKIPKKLQKEFSDDLDKQLFEKMVENHKHHLESVKPVEPIGNIGMIT